MSTPAPAPSSPPPIDPFAPPTANLDPGAEALPAEQPDASRWYRLGATLIDGVLYLPFVVLGFWLLPRSDANALAPGQYVSLLPLAFVQWYLVATTGQTLGKRWLGLRIVRMDGGPVDFMSGVLRRTWLVHGLNLLLMQIGLSEVGSLLNAVDVLLIFGSSRRTLHDHIAGTKVIALTRRAAVG